jgi:non-specific serine/threonine protein kinase
VQITRSELKKAVKTGTYSQAVHLHKSGAVEIHERFDKAARGVVKAGYMFEHKVSVAENARGQIESRCSCYSFGSICEHVAALVLAVLAEQEREEQNGPQAVPWENYLKNLPALPAARPGVMTPKSHKFVFFLKLNPFDWRLQPARVYIKKNGAFGQRSRLSFGYDGNLNCSEATDEEKKAVHELHQRKKARGQSSYHSYSYESVFEFEFEYGEEIGAVLDVLSGSELYLEDNAAAPARLRVTNSQAQLSFKLERALEEPQAQESYRFFPQIQLNGHAEPFDDSFRILASRPYWLLRERKIYRVEKSLPPAFLQPFTQKNYRLQVPGENVLGFLQAFTPYLKHNIDLALPENLSLQTAREITGRRLYLNETGDGLGVELKFAYGEIEVSGMRNEAVSLATNGGPNALWRVERDHAAEAATHEALLAAGLAREAGGEFYAPKQAPLDWIFDELPKLAEAGFEIFGEENLNKHRVNRAAPNVRLAVSSEIDWFDLNVEIDFNGIMLSLAELRQGVRQQSRYLKLADGSMARLPEEWEKRFRHFFNFAQVKEGKTQIASAHAMLIDALFDEVQDKRYDDEFQQRLRKLRNFKGIREIAPPENFRGALRPYQQAGLNWLNFLREYGLNGCLADDMGLGKTVQALALLLQEKNSNGHSTNGAAKKNGAHKNPEHVNGKHNGHASLRTSLIVAPLSVLFNWEKETANFAPDLKVLTHHGLERERGVEHFKEYDLVLTSYATMRNDIEFLKDYPFHYLILDESQNIKNPISQTAKAATILQGNHRLVLTGTPVENNTLELWSQFSFLNPGMLGSLHYFRGAFGTPIERYGDEDSAALLKKMISPFLLRRTKEQVATELPSKSEQVYYCAMDPGQKKLYEQVRDHYRAELMNLIDQSGLQDARFKILQGLTKLRQIACHPALLEEGRRKESGKFEAFMESLHEIVARGHKVLVFSQFVRMLKLIETQLQAEGHQYEMLTGHTRDRQACVERFQNDPSVKVFLISLKAGGFGLNLTAADYVFLYDPWWNPAAERQAIDRAHRIGQDKNVFVYKMITRDSVEEKILELQKRKETLVSQLISTEAGLFKHLTAEDIRGLFS